MRTLKDAPFQRDLFSQQKSLSLYGTFSRHKVKRYVPLCVNGPLCQRHAGGNKELLVSNLHRVCTRNLFVDALAVYLTNLLMSCLKLLANSQFNFCNSIVMQRCHQKFLIVANVASSEEQAILLAVGSTHCCFLINVIPTEIISSLLFLSDIFPLEIELSVPNPLNNGRSGGMRPLNP